MKSSKIARLRMMIAAQATTLGDNIIVISAPPDLPEIKVILDIEYQPKRSKKGKRQKDWQR